MISDELTLTMSKTISAMKRGEKARIEIQKEYVPVQDAVLYKILKEQEPCVYDENKALFAHINLHRLGKIEDWFKDGTTILKTLRKGKGRNPYTDSTIKFRL